jgi:hypothetical protein
MELTLLNSNKKVALADDVFGCDFNESLIHQIVVAHMAAARAGTKAQKTVVEGQNHFVKKGQAVPVQVLFVAHYGVRVVRFLQQNQDLISKK